MRTDNERESENVEDRRGMPMGTIIGGGGGAMIIALIVYLLGGDPSAVLNQAPPSSGKQQPVEETEESRAQVRFVKVVLANTEDVWSRILPQQANTQYQNPKLVLFSGQVQSACGRASAATGPFYCPGDQNLYIDLSFYDELKRKFKAPGDFAQAYVIAHEVGHHVQNLLKLTDKVDSQRGRVSEKEVNQLSVRLELQADFLAGVWAHHAQQMRNVLEPGDIDEALNAANAIGDDQLQKQGQGRVVPDSFTHGTSAQRIRWFKKGFQSGDIRQGDTFAVPYESL